MINRDDIARASSKADAFAEEHHLDNDKFWTGQGVDTDGLMHVAMQRGLRMVLINRGMDQDMIARCMNRTVRLSLTEQKWQIAYAGMFMDGFAAAMIARNE